MMNEITEKNLIEKLLEAVPEARARYDEESQWLDRDNTWVLSSQVLYRHIESLLKAKELDEPQIRRVFEFVEKLLGSNDPAVREIIEDSIVENICSDELVLQRARRYMGGAAKLAADRYLRGA